MNILVGALISLATGIPGIIVAGIALILVILALVRKESGFMVVAALLSIPSAYLMGAWSGILLAVRLLPVLALLSAFFISRDEPIFAWTLAVPPFGALIYFIFSIVVAGARGF